MTVGLSIPYTDAVARVTGRIEYVLNLSLPGMLHAAVLRSPHPHARITGIDASAALAVSGVSAVLTGQDILDSPEISPHFGPAVRDQPIIALHKVRFVGDPVAAVAAVDRETAEYAAGMIEVDYEPLPEILEIADALAPGAVLLHEELPRLQRPDFAGTNLCGRFNMIAGDVEAGMAQAEHIFEDVFRTPSAQHVPLEPHVCVAQVEPGRIQVWSATQTPYIIRAQIAELFNLPQNRVRVSVPTLGGGYGGKTQPKIEPLTTALAWKAGAPVKLTLTRAEEFITTSKHESIIKMRTGVMADGRLVARECELWWNAGAYADRSPSVAEVGATVATGPYRIPNVRAISHAVYTNRPPASAFRGFAVPQTAWAFETHMDRMAESLSLDPVAFRQQNLLRSGDTFCTGETRQNVAFSEVLDDAARAISWGEPSSAPGDPVRARGKGVAVIIKGTITPATSTAMVRVNSDGSCAVLASTVEMGQGSDTVLTQIAAQELGLPYERVTVVHPDTDVTPYDLSTNSSRSTYAMGSAVRLACEDVKRQALELAAGLLGREPESLSVRDGGVFVGEGQAGLTFQEIIFRARRGNLMGTGTHQTEGGLDPETGQGLGSTHWHSAAASAEVEVDRETGAVLLLNLHASLYTGQSINPANVELQTEGNMTFGIGKALLEEMVFDSGQLTNANLADYMVPSFEDLPSRMGTSQRQAGDPTADPHGVGETALPPIAPAIGNAIYRAVGARVMSLPLTPEKILTAMEKGLEPVEYAEVLQRHRKEQV